MVPDKVIRKNKVLLINPPTGICFRDGRCQGSIEHLTAQPERIPLELAYMAAIFETRGYQCRIRDFPMENTSWKDLEQEIEEFFPDILVLSVGSPTVDFDLKACQIARKINPKITTVAKGAHLYVFDEQILGKYPDLDIVIRGEVEFTTDDLANEKPLNEIAGITFRKETEIVRNPDRKRESDLDRLPFPARHLLKNDLYVRPDTKQSLTVIMTGRGCPYNCIFCLAGKLSGFRLTQRSPGRIADEIEACVSRHNIRNFFFQADTFTINKRWTIQVCREIISRNLDIEWGTNSRVDTIDEERLSWMKKAGCHVIGFGVESGNQETLDRSGKKITLEQSRTAVKLCRQFGIKTYLLFMIGFPWEDKTMVRQTIRFARELKGDFADFNVAYPYPGTDMYETCLARGLFNIEDLCGHDISRPMLRTEHLSRKQLNRLRKEAILRFYLRGGYIVRTLKSIHSLPVMINYLKKGCRMILKLLFPPGRGENEPL